MAEEDGATAGDAAPEPADGATLLLDWTCSLRAVERIDADLNEDDDEDVFSVEFQVSGVNADAKVEIIVSDWDDEVEVVAIALDTLHRAMKAWGQITENRRIAARDVIA